MSSNTDSKKFFQFPIPTCKYPRWAMNIRKCTTCVCNTLTILYFRGWPGPSRVACHPDRPTAEIDLLLHGPQALCLAVLAHRWESAHSAAISGISPPAWQNVHGPQSSFLHSNKSAYFMVRFIDCSTTLEPQNQSIELMVQSSTSFCSTLIDSD